MSQPIVSVMGEEEPIAIGFDALAAYHGQAALAMLAITFQGLRATLPILSPNAPPPRAAISVVSGHPGAGVRDAFEFVTRAVTRNVYTIDRTLPQSRFNPKAEISYSFAISLEGRTARAALKEGVLPARFFELLTIKDETAAAREEFSKLKRTIAARTLAENPAMLFTLG
jgi:hypothetical protein